MPVGGFQNAPGQMVTNETINAKNEDFFHHVTDQKQNVESGDHKPSQKVIF
jgi:hypothetical protein